MKISFDHQIFTHQSYGGISRYFVRLAHNLDELGDTVNIVAPIHRNRYLRDLPEAIVHGLEFNKFPAKSTRFILMMNNQLSKNKFRRLDADILHETYYSANSLTQSVGARIVTVHDMIHEIYSKDFPAWDRTSKNKRIAINRADHIICISNSTKNDLCNLFNVSEDKISVVHHGLERLVDLPHSSKPQFSNSRPFLLYVGSRWGYKNFERMLRAVASRPALINYFDIVAFGGGQFNAKELSLISKLEYGPNAVRHISGGDDVLCNLYAQAMAFVYPSLYEGFGLPPLEAMAFDCPVVVSNSSSLPEVVGDAGAYFNPLDIEAQADAISRVVYDDVYRKILIDAGRQRLGLFSWKRCACETRAVYEQILAAKN